MVVTISGGSRRGTARPADCRSGRVRRRVLRRATVIPRLARGVLKIDHVTLDHEMGAPESPCRPFGSALVILGSMTVDFHVNVLCVNPEHAHLLPHVSQHQLCSQKEPLTSRTFRDGATRAALAR
jgi:hypothetical protein